MTLITLPADTDAAAARAALVLALEQSGPPVTVRRPGRADLTVEVSPGEMTQRMARLWGRVYTTAVRNGQIPAPQAGVETEDKKIQRESAFVSTPASGAGNHGLTNRGGYTPAPFLLGKPAGVDAPAGSGRAER